MAEQIASYWLDWVMGIFAALIAWGYRVLYKKAKNADAKNLALEKGMVALLRDRIIQGYNHYKDKGCWPIYARDSMMDMFAQYTALGGNGTICTLIEELRHLPTEKRLSDGALVGNINMHPPDGGWTRQA